jgi:hypothetical protein
MIRDILGCHILGEESQALRVFEVKLIACASYCKKIQQVMQAQLNCVVEGVQTHLGFVFMEMCCKIVTEHFQNL